MSFGKHTAEGQKIAELENIIALKDKEIHDLKMDVSDILQIIRDINESNDYSAPEVKRRKISELCTDTRYTLLKDVLEQKNKATNTDQSNR